jgi:hypothetical protein
VKGLLLACLGLPVLASAGAFDELKAAAPELPAPASAPGRPARPQAFLRGGAPDGRTAAVLIHGLRGSVEEMSAIAGRLGRRHQVYALDYPDWGVDPSDNGRALAARLAELRAASGDGRPLLIVTHSLGGIVARAALNEMTASGELSRWGAVRVVCVDVPWQGIPSWRLPLPGALDELRARGPLLREGFLLERVADNVSIELVFASEGIAALDYTQGALDGLPAKLARYYAAGEPVSGSPRLMNFWHALLWSSQYPAFQRELRERSASGGLDAAAVSSALSAHFPRFPGGHTGVLSSPELLDYIER